MKMIETFKENQIEIILEGRHEDNGDADLDVFVQQLQGISEVLKKIDKDISGGNITIILRVIDLSHSSPARVVLAPYPKRNKPDNRAVILDTFCKGLTSLKNGQTPSFNYEMLEALKKVADNNGKKLEATIININDYRFDFNNQIAKNIDISLETKETCFTSYEGNLDQINVHGRNKMFHIYPISGPNKIRCNFNDSLYDQAVEAVGRKIRVEGIAKYRANAVFPHEINVMHIEAYLSDEFLPTFEDLRGKAPNITGGLSSEDFIVELRNEW